MPRERVKIGTRQTNPYGGALSVEPIYMDIPIKWEQETTHMASVADQLFNDNGYDEEFRQRKKTEPTLIRICDYRGFVCVRHDPYMHWTVERTLDGSEVPASLRGKFAGNGNLKRAIDAVVLPTPEQKGEPNK